MELAEHDPKTTNKFRLQTSWFMAEINDINHCGFEIVEFSLSARSVSVAQMTRNNAASLDIIPGAWWFSKKSF